MSAAVADAAGNPPEAVLPAEAIGLIQAVKMRKATTVDLTGMLVPDLSRRWLSEMVGVQRLVLTNCRLNGVPELMALIRKSLVTLHLAGNDLREIPENIGMLKNLKELDVRENKLTSLPRTLAACPLTYLDASHNSLVFIPKRLKKLARSLTVLNLTSNPLTPPAWIEGPGAILEYLTTKEQQHLQKRELWLRESREAREAQLKGTSPSAGANGCKNGAARQERQERKAARQERMHERRIELQAARDERRADRQPGQRRDSRPLPPTPPELSRTPPVGRSRGGPIVLSSSGSSSESATDPAEPTEAPPPYSFAAASKAPAPDAFGPTVPGGRVGSGAAVRSTASAEGMSALQGRLRFAARGRTGEGAMLTDDGVVTPPPFRPEPSAPPADEEFWQEVALRQGGAGPSTPSPAGPPPSFADPMRRGSTDPLNQGSAELPWFTPPIVRPPLPAVPLTSIHGAAIRHSPVAPGPPGLVVHFFGPSPAAPAPTPAPAPAAKAPAQAGGMDPSLLPSIVEPLLAMGFARGAVLEALYEHQLANPGKPVAPQDLVDRILAPPPSANKPSTAATAGEACRVCYDKPIDTVILRCGHVAVCHGCASQMTTCPICRAPIVEVVRTYSV